MIVSRSLFALALLIPLTTGCGESSDYPTAAVTGKVTFNGMPSPDRTVIFTPQPKDGAAMTGKSATGTTDAQGNFTLSTYAPNDGAVVGMHKVSVSEGDPNNPPPGKSPPDLTLEVKPGSNEFTIELVP